MDILLGLQCVGLCMELRYLAFATPPRKPPVGMPDASSHRWLPSSARLVALGGKSKGSGLLQVLELGESSLSLRAEEESTHTLRCATLGSTTAAEQAFLTGDAKGEVRCWQAGQLLRSDVAWTAHEGMVNSMTGYRSQGSEMAFAVTGGADGAVKVWDCRQIRTAAFIFEEQPSGNKECWAVAAGDAGRAVLAGYDSGGLSLLDLRAGRPRWTGGVPRGVSVCAFDRPDIAMNKFLVACLGGGLHAFDARTQHPQLGFAECRLRVDGDATLWGCSPLPQNRDIFATNGADGYLRMFKYRYPDRRSVKDADTGASKGVAGSLERLSEHQVSEQPLTGLHWHPDKTGLFCCTAVDQILRVGLVTKLHLH